MIALLIVLLRIELALIWHMDIRKSYKFSSIRWSKKGEILYYRILNMSKSFTSNDQAIPKVFIIKVSFSIYQRDFYTNGHFFLWKVAFII